METAIALLWRVGGMRLDKHLFQLQDDFWADLTSFYKSTMEAWKVFTISRSSDEPAGLWLFEEPIFFNSLLQSRLMSVHSLHSRLIAAGCTKLGHVLSSKIEELSERTGVKSLRLLKKAISEIRQSLNEDYEAFLNDPIKVDQWRKGVPYDFPSLTVTISMVECGRG
ncbi:hypothetical protein QQF64_034210 [Cirrhinus molitorella]|uniref:Uncharacterized protein n=1 Tax=Cirrhinus molitorella TaxID=172907 RepID=A0ABR3MW36_9TELE